jgi:5-methylcytosine-specific restriction endonuclease McrA
MSRREFSKQTKRDAFLRANGKCEGENCGARLTLGKFHYDHVIPDGLGGEPSLDNCAVLCMACHSEKTRKRDVPAIAKAKRIEDRQRGIRKPSTFACSRDSKFKRKINGSVVLR